MPNAVGQKLNKGMPNKREDWKAYDRERKRRIKAGTWIRRGESHGYGRMSQHCECHDCKNYQRGYAAGYRAAMAGAAKTALYEGDPYMLELLP